MFGSTYGNPFAALSAMMADVDRLNRAAFGDAFGQDAFGGAFFPSAFGAAPLAPRIEGGGRKRQAREGEAGGRALAAAPRGAPGRTDVAAVAPARRGLRSTELFPFSDAFSVFGSGALDFAPRLEVVDRPDATVAKFDVPGVPRENLDVRVDADSGTVTVSGETSSGGDRRADDGSWVIRERRYGNFSRTIALPADALVDQVTSSLDHGVLTLHVPRSQQPAADVDQGKVEIGVGPHPKLAAPPDEGAVVIEEGEGADVAKGKHKNGQKK